VDLRKLKEQASRLVVEGRYERAEVLYRQLLTVAPRDSGLWLKHADLLKRLGEVAIKASPLSPWIVVTAATPIEVKFFDEFPVSEEALWLEAPSR
jgi:hypothetical protein